MMSDLHPNWCALATVYFPRKIFVTEGTSSSSSHDNAESKKINPNKIINISGEEAQQFYVNTVNTESNLDAKKCNRLEYQRNEYLQRKHGSPSKPEKVAFNKNQFFKAALYNDVATLKSFHYKTGDLDVTDEFGWTGLMMAACEGSAESFSYLLKLGADLNKTDRKGNTAISFAKLKGFKHILDLVENLELKKPQQKNVSNNSRKSFEPFYCKICNREFKETSKYEHETSTLHRFNMKSNKKSTTKRFNVADNNRGLKLMLKQGWDRNSGLGPTNNGQLYPIKTVIRKNRTGLGIKQDEPKVTHFKAYDTDAIKYKAPPRRITRKDLENSRKREKRKEIYYRQELN